MLFITVEAKTLHLLQRHSAVPHSTAKTLRLLHKHSVLPNSRGWDIPSPTQTVFFLTTEAKTSLTHSAVPHRMRLSVSYTHSAVPHSRGQDITSPTQTVLFLTAEAKKFHLLRRHSVLPHSRGWDIPSPTLTVFFLTVEAKTCLLPRHSAVPHSRGWQWHIVLLTQSAIPHKWQERLTDLLMRGKMDRGGDGAQGDLAWHRCLATRPAPLCKQLWCPPPPGPQPPDLKATL